MPKPTLANERRVCTYVPPALADALQRHATRNGLTVSQVLRSAVVNFVRHHEVAERGLEAKLRKQEEQWSG